MKVPSLFPLILALLLVPSVLAEIVPAGIFADNMVLQRDRPIPVWGTADPGEEVMVIFNQVRLQTKADKNRLWQVTLPPQPANAQPSNLLIMGPNNRIRVSEVLVGDIWLCSGQSNMEMTLISKWGNVLNANAELADANLPLVRQFKMPLITSDVPLTNYHGTWSPCNSSTAADFTAIGYFFAKEVSGKTGIPIGIINASWGGSFIESWIPLPALKADSAFSAVFERWSQSLKIFPDVLYKYNTEMDAWRKLRAQAQEQNKSFNERAPRYPRGIPLGQDMLAGTYNAMIHPFTTFPIKGILWYQGESNAERYSEYEPLFKTLITQWRESFSNPDMPFYFVQLTNFRTGAPWAFLREAQAKALSLPNTGMAVGIDAGEERNIHPPNKQILASRLAAIALTRDYGISTAYQGPTYKSFTIEGNSIRIHFDHAEGLINQGTDETAHAFEVAGNDRIFHPAMVRVDGSSLIVSSEKVPSPIAVRYAWHSNPNATLYNADKLPAPPFRTDSWTIQD